MSNMAYRNVNEGNDKLVIGKDISSDLFARVLISAERYACGRASYIVGFVTSAIKRYSSILSREQIKAIIDDVEVNVAGDSSGWDVDANDWASLLSALKPTYELGDEDIIGVKQNDNMTISQTDWQLLSCGAAIRYDEDVKSDKRNVSIQEYVDIIKRLPSDLAMSAKATIASDIAITDQWVSFTHDPNVPTDLYPLRMLVGLPDPCMESMSSDIYRPNTAMIGA